MPMLVAFHGLPGCGKDTAANRLIETGAWAKVSFAAPLKRGISTMMNIPMEHIENPIIKNKPNYKFGKSIRDMMRTLGTEWARETVDDNVWIDIAQESIDYYFALDMNVVITDCRFPNESAYIKERGGRIIHVIRNEPDACEYKMIHASDAGIPTKDVDRLIYNRTTIEEFQDEVFSYITEIILNEE